jgi:hypothetical protein
MTVALLLAAAPDRLSAMTRPYRQPGDRLAGDSAVIDSVGGRLLDAGVGRVEVAMCSDAADGLRAVAATARRSAEPVLVCTAARVLATPRAALAALLAGTGSAAVTASGMLLAARQDLPAVADAAEALAERVAAGYGPPGRRPRRHLSVRRINRKMRVSAELNDAAASLIDDVAASGITLTSLSVRGAASIGRAPGPAAGQAVRQPRPGQEDGLVAALAVAPLAGRIARSAAGRGLAPNALTLAALALTGCAAAWFAAGSRSGLIAGAVLLCAALPVRQARGLLPAAGLAGAAFGGWLDAMTASAGEYAVYACLAVGWSPARPQQAWELAIAAMVLLAVRQMADACYASAAPPRQEMMRGPGYRMLRLAGQSITLPAAERTLLIAVTAPVWGPRMALIALVGWGVVALGYSVAERAVAGRVPDAVRDAGDSGRTARSGAR